MSTTYKFGGVVEDRMPMYGDPTVRMRAVDDIVRVLRDLSGTKKNKEVPGVGHVTAMLADKLTRVALNPMIEDHWDDIIGYGSIGKALTHRVVAAQPSSAPVKPEGGEG